MWKYRVLLFALWALAAHAPSSAASAEDPPPSPGAGPPPAEAPASPGAPPSGTSGGGPNAERPPAPTPPEQVPPWVFWMLEVEEAREQRLLHIILEQDEAREQRLLAEIEAVDDRLTWVIGLLVTAGVGIIGILFTRQERRAAPQHRDPPVTIALGDVLTGAPSRESLREAQEVAEPAPKGWETTGRRPESPSRRKAKRGASGRR